MLWGNLFSLCNYNHWLYILKDIVICRKHEWIHIHLCTSWSHRLTVIQVWCIHVADLQLFPWQHYLPNRQTWLQWMHTVDGRYNKLLGPSEITLLYRNFVISGLQKQYNTKKCWTLGPRKLLCYIRILLYQCSL